MKQSIKQNIESPPEDRQEAKAHQIYDKAAKAAFSKEVVLGLMVKRSIIGDDDLTLDNARSRTTQILRQGCKH